MNKNYLLLAGEEFSFSDFKKEIFKFFQNKGLAGLYTIKIKSFKQKKLESKSPKSPVISPFLKSLKLKTSNLSPFPETKMRVSLL